MSILDEKNMTKLSKVNCVVILIYDYVDHIHCEVLVFTVNSHRTQFTHPKNLLL